MRRVFPGKCRSRGVESNSDPRSLPLPGTIQNRPSAATSPGEEVTQVGTAPATAREALDMVRAGLGYLAAADAAQLPAATQAECLRELEQDAAALTAARAGFLAAFTAGQGPAGDGDYSAVSWLIHRTGITRGAAVGHTAWAKRAAHASAGAGGAGRGAGVGVRRAGDLPVDRQAAAGAPGRGGRAAAGRVRRRAGAGGPGRRCSPRCTCGPGGTCPDQDPGREFADREVKLATTIGGAGVMHGDLTAGCAAAVAAVLDALAAPAGKDDDRTKGQRYHDALAEAMRRLTAAGLLPERAGQPVKAWAHISLADLMLLDGDSALQEEWTERVRARWAARRAYAAETGANDGAWLDGDAAGAIACDAAMAPIVTGDVNVDALEDLVRLCVELDRLRQGGDSPAAGTTAAGAALEQAVIGKAVDLLSGPGGLAVVPAPPAARRPPRRAEPAAGHRVRRDRPGGDPQRGAAAGPALPVGRRLHPARRGLRGAPHQAQGPRREDLREGLRAAVPVPPPGRDPPLGLDPGRQPRRDDHRVEQEQDQSAAQPRAARPGRVRAPGPPEGDRLHHNPPVPPLAGCLLGRERPDLDRAVPHGGVRARDPERLLQVRAFDDVEAGDLLFRLGERAVGDEKLAIARAYRRGVPRRLQVTSLQVHAARDGVFQPGRQQRLVFPALLGVHLVGFVHVVQQQELHAVPPRAGSGIVMRREPSGPR